MTEKNFHVSVLHETTNDQWACESDLYINADEAQIVMKVIEILVLKRKKHESVSDSAGVS